jgi:hypothetical protein
MLRLPIWSLPPRFAAPALGAARLAVPALGARFAVPALGPVLPARLAALGPVLPARLAVLGPALPARFDVPALGPDRLPVPACWRALACRLLRESPRADPPYLLAVALSAYGVPPRWLALCCQLPPPALMLVFRLKLLLTLMLILLLPQPQPQHEPPQIAAPQATPTLNATKAPPA